MDGDGKINISVVVLWFSIVDLKGKVLIVYVGGDIYRDEFFLVEVVYGLFVVWCWMSVDLVVY